MTVAVAAETRISHSVARVSATPAAAPRSLSRQVRDNDFLNSDSRTGLKNLNRDYICGRKSRIDVILEDHIGDRFFGASELSDDIKQFGEVGIERLSGSGTESIELPEERHSSDRRIGSVCAGLQFFPHLDGILYSLDVYFDSIGTGSIDDGYGLQFLLLVVLVYLLCQN